MDLSTQTFPIDRFTTAILITDVSISSSQLLELQGYMVFRSELASLKANPKANARQSAIWREYIDALNGYATVWLFCIRLRMRLHVLISVLLLVK